MFIDTHTHIYLPHFSVDSGSMMFRAKQAGVEKMLLPNIDRSTVKDMLLFAGAYPGRLHCMIGLHPGSVKKNYINELNYLETFLDSGSFVAVGEIGIDLYWDYTYKSQQIDAFRTQCEWAVKKNIPVSIHSRAATDEVIRQLMSMQDIPRGIFHCFEGNKSRAKEVIDLGFKIGVGGNVTFKNSQLPNVLKHLEPSNLVLETDAPYLAPHPFRGKRNEPALIRLTAQKLAETYGTSVEDIAATTQKNAIECFKLGAG
ncbi:MAG: TatD family hydrolase [Candidatus Delongbacteria bacterium]|jgi:TatD DNase family protein|nr:TatD family hydrolase [Candidatus Delongbacteria bacterium]